MPKQRKRKTEISKKIRDENAIKTSEILNNSPILTTPKSGANLEWQENILSTPIRNRFDQTFNITNLNLLFNCSQFDFDEDIAKPNQDIMETPKIPGRSLIVARSTTSEKSEYNDNLLSNQKKCKNTNKTIVHYVDASVNLNPYAKNQDVVLVQKDSSFGEVSFFAPQLYDLKSASTPIDKLHKSPKNAIIDKNKLDKVPSFMYGSPERNAINDSKNIRDESKIKDKCIINRSNKFKRNQQNSSTSTLRRKQSNCGIRARILMCIRRFVEKSALWARKIADFCNFVGVALVKSCSAISKLYWMDKFLNSSISDTMVCKCDQFRSDIGIMQKKIDELNEELFILKNRIDEPKMAECKNSEIQSELEKIKFEMAEFRHLIADLDAINKQEIAPPAPPLPPSGIPPPPPPPPPISVPKNKVMKKIDDKSKENVDPRPIISLDDILKVKLKKTSERPSPYSKPNRPSNSDNLLRRTKLKSCCSRTQTPSTHSISTNDSPRSSLTKILNNDGEVRVVKRLKRVGGYSCDDISKRHQFKGNLDRERTYY